MPKSVSAKPRHKFNFIKFMQYLGRTFVSLALAPALVFIISFSAYFFGNTSTTLCAILWECLYVDVLFSILTICVIISFSSEYRVQLEIKRYFGRPSSAYSWLRRACYVVLFVLSWLEILYKIKKETPIQNCLVFNLAVTVGFCICIITQCISHPKAYFCP